MSYAVNDGIRIHYEVVGSGPPLVLLLVPRDMLDRYWKTASVEQLSQLFAVFVPVIKNRLAFEYGVR